MSINLNKDKIQRESLNVWYKKGCYGSLELATGVGKTRIGILAALYFAKKYAFDIKILIITPTETIRDYSWKDEFVKWKALDVYDNCVRTECINTIYKWKDKHFDLIIADEIHNFLPDHGATEYEFYKFFEQNTWDNILGLSGSISLAKHYYLNKIAPIVYTLSTPEAVELGLVAPYKIYNIPIEFTDEERKEYQSLTVRIGALKERGYKAWGQIGQRKILISNAINKLAAVEELVPIFEEDYGIIFSQYTDFVDQITSNLGEKCVSFHSKVSKKQRKLNLEAFSDGRTKVKIISTAKALNEGANLPRLNYAIIVAGTSKDKDVIQRIGRIIRFEENKQATLIRLYVPNTQETKWLTSSQSKFEVRYLTDIKELKKIITWERLRNK